MSDLEAAVPADIGAEIALLANLLHYPQTGPDAWRLIAPSDFYRPMHAELAALFADLGDYDPQQVHSESFRRGLPQVAAFLPTIAGRHTVPDYTRVHAEQIRDCARRRRLIEAATRAVQDVGNPTSDLTVTLGGLLAVAEELLDTATTDVAPPVTVADFLLGEDRQEWVVPGLLERGDRVLVTGGEGGGKSVFLRQIAVGAAAGVHPFTLAEVEPARVLIVDMENSRSLLRRNLRYLLWLADRSGRPVDADRLRIVHRPAGVDLGDLADVGWLAREVELARPDLIVGGPLYRLHSASLDKEDAARAITVALDGICARARAALILEAHAPHGMGNQRWWRPAGSSLFMRWAAFGLGLQPNKDGGVTVEQWRGAHDERFWPEALRRGGKGNWPWVEDVPAWDGRVAS